MEGPFPRRNYAATAVLAVLSDMAYSIWTYGVANNSIALAILGNLLMPFINLLSVAIFIDAKTWKQRFWIAACTALGYAIGTVGVLAFLGRR
jgi:drug/metabolite transporter (DMT)-like permease